MWLGGNTVARAPGAAARFPTVAGVGVVELVVRGLHAPQCA